MNDKHIITLQNNIKLTNNNSNNDNNIVPTSNRNIFPDSLERTLFHKMDPIVKSLSKQSIMICRNKLSEQYIQKAFNKFHFGYCYRDLQNEVVGFSIWKEFTNEDRHIFIYLICSKLTYYKLGKIMLFDIESFAIKNKIYKIILKPVPDKISYYEDNGYIKFLQKKDILMEKNFNVVKLKNAEEQTQRNKHKRTYKLTTPNKFG